MVECHENGRMVKGTNCSFMVFIPKKRNLTKVSNYRTISLIGCIYKLISKVIANRFKKVIGPVISESQSAFISDRQILDVILLTNEIVDEARRKKKEVLLFKVDFEKAYDSVDWKFLYILMTNMGFHENWRKWIAECLKTFTVSVLINGSPTNEFRMERGLRQGDYISPFLFLTVVEGFNILMKKAVNGGKFGGYKFENREDRFMHLQYADDTLIIMEKIWANIRAIKANLLLFKMMLGLKVNFNKS